MTAQPDPDQTARPGPQDAPTLLGEVLSHLTNLVRHEIALAKSEMSQSASKAGLGIALFVIATLFGFAALNLLAAASVAAIMALGLGWGWAALVAALVWGAVAGALALWGRSTLSAESLLPNRTFAALREDAHILKELTDG